VPSRLPDANTVSWNLGNTGGACQTDLILIDWEYRYVDAVRWFTLSIAKIITRFNSWNANWGKLSRARVTLVLRQGYTSSLAVNGLVG